MLCMLDILICQMWCDVGVQILYVCERLLHVGLSALIVSVGVCVCVTGGVCDRKNTSTTRILYLCVRGKNRAVDDKS